MTFSEAWQLPISVRRALIEIVNELAEEQQKKQGRKPSTSRPSIPRGRRGRRR